MKILVGGAAMVDEATGFARNETQVASCLCWYRGGCPEHAVCMHGRGRQKNAR